MIDYTVHVWDGSDWYWGRYLGSDLIIPSHFSASEFKRASVSYVNEGGMAVRRWYESIDGHWHFKVEQSDGDPDTLQDPGTDDPAPAS